MWRQILSVIAGTIFLPTLLLADDSLWVQVEAQPSLLEAEDRARKYAERLPNVHAFSLGSGWYAIAVGPYTQDEIELEYQNLRTELEIPFDSFISTGDNFRQKIWSPGSQTAENTDVSGSANILSQAVEVTQGYDFSAIDRSKDETLDLALQSEAALDTSSKKDLQRALQWAGYYTSSIDGMFGTGTRNSMKQWQDANQFPQTGVLSTLQRDILLKQYDQILVESGIEKITDLQTGVIINLPMGVLEFSHYEPPLAHFKATDGGPQSAYVISQKGNKAALRALYRALQTLSILPPDGSRRLYETGFSITGQNSQITSVAEAFMSQGEIKGYILVWPSNDDTRSRRLFRNIKNSFETISGVLEPTAGTGALEEVDALFGLDLRQPLFSRSGIFATSDGHVITDASGLEQCDEITIRPNYKAKILSPDEASGFAILAPESRLVPLSVAQFARGPLGLSDQVISAGYSYEGRLDFPSITQGTVDEMRGLDGSEDIIRLSIPAMKGDAGGPILNQAGAVSGLLLDASTGPRSLPHNVHLALKSQKIIDRLASLGIFVQSYSGQKPTEDVLLAKQARSITALVNCWQD